MLRRLGIQPVVRSDWLRHLICIISRSDVSGRAQSPEPGPARPSKARPEAGLGSGFQWARAWLEDWKARSPGLEPGPPN
jgi:hypothetical protein